MTIQFQEVTAGESKEMPARICIYGKIKIGKSRFAAESPDPFYIDCEGGLNFLGKKVRSTGKLNDFDSVLGWLRYIHDDEKFQCGTIVIDSLDFLEEFAQQRLVKQYNAKSINDPSISAFAYYKGYVTAATDSMVVLKWLDAIYKKKGIKCILIAHNTTKEVELPGKDPFTRYQLKLSKQFGAKVMEWCDILLHAEYDFHVTSEGKTSELKPVLFSGGAAFYEGGGRVKLPNTIPISYKALEDAILGKKS